jgi:N-methylhydantoinase A/oxoprolinase/acetone carboxylase beta subunit
VEVVAIRATARLAAPVSVATMAPVARQPVDGPAVVAEPDCTIWVPAGWRAEPHASGAFVIGPVRR